MYKQIIQLPKQGRLLTANLFKFGIIMFNSRRLAVELLDKLFVIEHFCEQLFKFEISVTLLLQLDFERLIRCTCHFLENNAGIIGQLRKLLLHFNYASIHFVVRQRMKLDSEISA